MVSKCLVQHVVFLFTGAFAIFEVLSMPTCIITNKCMLSLSAVALGFLYTGVSVYSTSQC